MRLIHKDDGEGYKLFLCDLIAKNQDGFVQQSRIAIERFNTMFPNKSSTGGYKIYNAFALTAGFPLFHSLYDELTTVMRNFARDRKPLWFQSWINFHMPEEVLDWHDHSESFCHGFVSILPHESRTVLERFEVIDRPGVLYIGPSYKKHRVIVDRPYASPRITLAFDVFGRDEMRRMIEKDANAINLSMLPI